MHFEVVFQYSGDPATHALNETTGDLPLVPWGPPQALRDEISQRIPRIVWKPNGSGLLASRSHLIWITLADGDQVESFTVSVVTSSVILDSLECLVTLPGWSARDTHSGDLLHNRREIRAAFDSFKKLHDETTPAKMTKPATIKHRGRLAALLSLFRR